MALNQIIIAKTANPNKREDITTSTNDQRTIYQNYHIKEEDQTRKCLSIRVCGNSFTEAKTSNNQSTLN